MMKMLKYILVFGLPALVCGIVWTLGVTLLLLIVDRSGDQPLFTDIGVLAYCVVICSLTAFLSGLFFRKKWLTSAWPGLVGRAILHEIVGATLFGTFIFPIYGTVFGFFLSFPLLPVQIFGSLSFIILHRHLARRFDLVPPPTSSSHA